MHVQVLGHVLRPSFTLRSLPSSTILSSTSESTAPDMAFSVFSVDVTPLLLPKLKEREINQLQEKEKKQTNKKLGLVRGHPLKPVLSLSLDLIVCLFPFQRYICLYFSSSSNLFPVRSPQYAVFLSDTIHTPKQQEGVLFICHMPSSVLDSTVISGLQYFSHCSQFYCTVLCNFHMDVYDFICCHKSLEIM